MKKVIVAGANGFIGKHVSRLMKSNGWEVIGIGHGKIATEDYSLHGIDNWYNDDVNYKNIYKIIEHHGEPDCIMQMAGSGSVRFSFDHPAEDYWKTVNTTLGILEAVRKHSPNCKIVYPSSAAVYGDSLPVPISEKNALNPISPYGSHKRIAEALCENYGNYFGVKSVIGRIFSVYGDGLQKQIIWDICCKLNSKSPTVELYGTGEEERDFLHVNDTARALVSLIPIATKEVPKLNIASGTSIPIKELAELVRIAFGVNKKIVFNQIKLPGDPGKWKANVTPLVDYTNFKVERLIKDGILSYVSWFKSINGMVTK